MFSYQQIAAFRSMKTPFYFYDMDLLAENLSELRRQADRFGLSIHYALKANVNAPVLKMIKEAGFGADCVSGNEIRKALESGFAAEDIVFAGVGKTDEEIVYGLRKGINCFNVESVHELKVMNALAGRLGVKAPVALRINPDVDARTVPGITTGTRLDKFGIDKNEVTHVLKILPRLSGIEFKGLHFHIGSQITDLNVFRVLSGEVNKIQERFISAGFVPALLNLGGGLGVDYKNPDAQPVAGFEAYFRTILEGLNRLPGQTVHFEPGRSLVARCGSLISSVLFIKNSGHNQFIILDAGMHNLMRPALYGAEHKIQNLTGIGTETVYQVAGPVCESSDIFGRNVLLPETKRGDLLAIRTAGAYGEVMASAYNLREAAPAVYSDDFGKSGYIEIVGAAYPNH
ncbi:MAG: diaminopimelate decarboxylase [Bacteroidales bacterium]|nr:diaminopimelate decarboxylase [Bacteroidales bacterium]